MGCASSSTETKVGKIVVALDYAKPTDTPQKPLPFHPSIQKVCMQSLVTNFPGAIYTIDAFRKINNAIISIGCDPNNTLFASSVCVDEINHLPTSINSRLAQYWGECFYMGGLGGIPFIGKTGYKAYSHHIPKGGNVFILFAPHVGVAPDGTVGKFAREGQDHLDSACGAAIGAFNTLKTCLKDGSQTEVDAKKLEATNGDYDVQFREIKNAMVPKFNKISSHQNPMTGVAYAMYEIAK